jgi:hypothetical protein
MPSSRERGGDVQRWCLRTALQCWFSRLLGSLLARQRSHELRNAGDGFGTAVACGDTDRDGFADVLIGAPSGTPMQSGYARMFRGAAMPMTSAVRTYMGNTMTRLGAAVSVMGDCNGDGFDDIVISATAPTGVVRVHLGSAASVGLGEHQMYTGDAASGFGAKLAR